MKRQLNIISHTHWDREWYMSHEKHRMRLVRFMDDLLDLLERDPAYTCFHLDGQTVMVHDYLEIRPAALGRILALARAGRLFLGPWYVLQDEYLISGEANIRNLIAGLDDCARWGVEPVRLGYLPDAFGNISQMPQILAEFGIRYAAFGRGLTEVGADNAVLASSGVRESELYWEAADGSRVLAVVFANWYNNAMELKADRACFDRLLQDCERFASTPYLLGMNGCDHQPVQADLSSVLERARAAYPDTEIVQTDFMSYMKKLEGFRKDYTVCRGEIAGQYTRGFVTFTNTASSRVPVKQRNFAVARSLERVAEPLCAMAGDRYEYPRDVLEYAWRTLLQNYAHDSICCCNVDAVAADMAVRFDRAEDAALSQAERAKQALASSVDTGESPYNIVLFTAGTERGVCEASAYIDLPEGERAAGWELFEGAERVPCRSTALGRTFTYALPDDCFRKPRYVQCYRLDFCVHTGGEIGLRTLRALPSAAREQAMPFEGRTAQNEYLRVSVREDGSLDVTVLATGREYRGLNVYADEGEIGEGYTHVQTDDRLCTDTRGGAAKISVSSTAYAVVWRVEQKLRIPACRRGRERSRRMLVHTIVTEYRLLRGARRVEVRTELENRAKDHRLRALFACGMHAQTVFADGQFDLVRRNVQTTPVWENPSNDQRMLAFAEEREGTDTFCIASRGLHEYEAMRDGSGVLALTLLRCFGEMGDWGYFPAPGAQCEGKHTFEYALVFGSADGEAEEEAAVYAYRPVETAFTGAHGGDLAPHTVCVGTTCKNARFSCFKRARDGSGDILRLYNPTEEEGFAELTLHPRYGGAVRCTAEERDCAPAQDGNRIRVVLPAKKIVTLRLYRQGEKK